jgi:hypothetical protein
MEGSIAYQLSDSTQTLKLMHYVTNIDMVLFIWKLKQIQPTGEVSFINEPKITLIS